MSMPDFPEGVLDLTCDQVFHMLLGSIAMEELALSHIMNAEGEKLQYVLGTLPGKPCPRATPQEVLLVNRSVSDLLEKVAYNQLLLKGKLQQVLEARNTCCPPAPPCPPNPCQCVWTAERESLWSRDCPLPWKSSRARGVPIAWQKCASSSLYLAPEHTYFTSFSLQVRPCEPGPIRAVLRELCSGGQVLATCESAAVGSVAHLTGCALLPRDERRGPLQFALETPSSVVVERGEWTLVTV